MDLPVVDDPRSQPDNVLPYPDQALFLALRGADQGAVMQALWVYDHEIDLDRVKKFHEYFSRGLVARGIESSPLPFGRHRWVALTGTQPEFDVAENPRDRAELYDWADEQVALPLDPEWGPGWRLAGQRLTDGATAVSLVVSHCIADGVAAFMACVEAINGTTRDTCYPPPRSRTRGRAVLADLRQMARDAPEIARTLRKAIKTLFQRRTDLTRTSTPPMPSAAGDRIALVPSASIAIDIESWDALAERLGGNSFSLVAGFAGNLAQRLNRTRESDGAVTLMIPVSEREGLEDTGGNMVSIANVSFDPVGVTADLTGVRTAIRNGLKTARDVPDEMVELLPLIPFLPKRALARIADVAFGFSTDLPVSVSNFGDLPADLGRLDGTDAEHFSFRGVDRNVTHETLDRRGGILTVTAGRIAGKITMTVISYQPGMQNSQSGLRQVIGETLAEFGLTGEIA